MNQRKPALPPGSLIYVGDELKHAIHLQGFVYGPEALTSFDVRTAAQLPEPGANEFLWLNINGLHRVPVIESIGRHFQIPVLTLEDILNTEQRPKLDEIDDKIFVVLKMLYLHEERIAYEHISLVLTPSAVISFQEQPWDVFEPVRNRLELKDGRLRQHGPDYLAYALIDAIVDNYLVIMDFIEDKIETLESEILDQTSPDSIRDLHAIQQELIFISKSFRGAREVLNRIQRRDNPLITSATHLYLADACDHMMHAEESLDVQRQLLNSLDNLHFSLLNHKTNEVMKVLTLYASIFLPLSFVAALYGMNFQKMPELEWPMGYPAVLLLMAGIAAGMIVYFRKKNWL